MVAEAHGKLNDEIKEVAVSSMPTTETESGTTSAELSTLGFSSETGKPIKFLNFFKGFRGGAKRKRSSHSTSIRFQPFALERDEISRSQRNFKFPFSKKIDWNHLWCTCKKWFRNPLNIALFVWIVAVAISGAILFLVMTGMLNHALPSKSKRDVWFEVNNQILNALFTLMCLYQHPKRIYHVILLLRWEQKDISALRLIYCKNGTYKPNERMHMMVVVLLLNLNCFAQYVLCSLNVGYRRSRRPAIGVGVSISVAISAAAFASLYNIVSPLGKDYDVEIDQEAQFEVTSADGRTPKSGRLKSFERRYSFVASEVHRFTESSPQWIGGLFDLWDDLSLAYLSVFCSCCVFGWNMQRLGFGNMYVHIVTFLLFCLAPFFIFNLAAVNINNENLREALGLTGVVLCILGLLYGGFWRTQMRKRYNLPGNDFCCGHPSVTDFFQWLCCCYCSLAQEVRTADYYKVAEEKTHVGNISERDDIAMSPLSRENGISGFRSLPSSPFQSKASPYVSRMGDPSTPGRYSRMEQHNNSSADMFWETMKAPAPSVIRRERDPDI